MSLEKNILVYFDSQKATKLGNQTAFYSIHFGTNIQERLLNKPYVNEVTLTGQNPPLKYC